MVDLDTTLDPGSEPGELSELVAFSAIDQTFYDPGTGNELADQFAAYELAQRIVAAGGVVLGLNHEEAWGMSDDGEYVRGVTEEFWRKLEESGIHRDGSTTEEYWRRRYLEDANASSGMIDPCDVQTFAAWPIGHPCNPGRQIPDVNVAVDGPSIWPWIFAAAIVLDLHNGFRGAGQPPPHGQSFPDFR